MYSLFDILVAALVSHPPISASNLFAYATLIGVVVVVIIEVVRERERERDQ